MSDKNLIAIATEHARTIFNAPDLVYDPGLVFQNIRGFDSVVAVQFILAIEGAFNIMIAEEEVDNMNTMGDLINTLRAKVQPSEAAA